MAYVLKRIQGKYGQLWLQSGVTTSVSDSTTPNTAIEIVDGVSYDPFQVYTQDTAAKIPLDPNTDPTVTPAVGSGAALPPFLTWEVNFMRGKIIMTPALATGNTVNISLAATPKMYAIGDSISYDLAVKADKIDAHAMMDGWKRPLVSFAEWSGSVEAYWKNLSAGTGSAWWLAHAGIIFGPQLIRFYPAKGIGSEYYIGLAIIEWAKKVPMGDTIKQAMTLTGVGPLIEKAS